MTGEEERVAQVEYRNLDVVRWALCRLDLSKCETIDGVYEQVRLTMEQEQNRTDGRILAVR